jgi:hypothetical protein
MSTEALIKYYKSIVQIRLDLQTVLEDLAYQNDNGHIFYAVDNDVIKLYSNPEDKCKYVRSFHDEPTGNLIPHAYNLAEYIFKYLTEEPLLTLPTLRTEFTYIFEAIWNDANAGHKVKQEQLVELKELFIDYPKILNTNQLIDDMLSHCNALCRYLVQDESATTDAETELQRISHLVDSNNLANIEKQPWFHTIPSQAALFIEGKNWYVKLRNNHPSKPSYKVLDDAKTLAYVALVNRSLQESSKKQKLCFITGDTGIPDVLATDPTANENIPVRHPRIYRVFTRLFNYSGTKNNLQQGLQEYKKLLDDFLMPVLLDSKGNEDRYLFNLNAIAKGDKEASYQCNDNVDEKIKAIRSELFKIAALNQNIQNEPEKLKLWLQSYFNKDQAQLDKLLVDIEASLKAKWDSSYASLKKTYIGIGTVNMSVIVSSLDLHHVKIGKRQPGWHRLPAPLVSYATNDEPDDLFKNIRKALYTENYAGIMRLLQSSELSLGKMYLVSALIAAEAQAWESVKDFCISAVENVGKDLNAQHEAYYFWAIAIRHHCKDAEEYRTAFDLLKKAEILWKKQHEKTPNALEALRFQVEHCAQIMGYYNYKRFIAHWNDSKFPAIPDLETTWDTLLKLASNLEQDINSNSHILPQLKRQLYTSICSLFLFIKLVEEKDSCDGKVVKQFLEKLSTLIRQDVDHQSYYVEATIALCEYTLDLEHNRHSQEKYAELVASVEKSLSYTDLLLYEKTKRDYFLKVLKDKSKFSS